MNVNLRCSHCGEGFYSASPRDHHGDPCSRCGGMLIFSKQIDDRLGAFVNKTYVSTGIERLELYANKEAA